MEMCAEDLTVNRSQAADDDDDDHDDHDDSDKINDTEGVDPERLKAFNVCKSHAPKNALLKVYTSISHMNVYLLLLSLC